MKLALAIASFFALAVTLVRGGSISGRATPSFQDSCGSPTILQNTTVAFQNVTIGFVSATCPIANCSATKRAIEGRDPICTTGNCAVTCADAGDGPIVVADCVPVIEYLQSLGSQNFSVAAQTFDAWYLGTCTVAFWNYDCVDYTVCYGEFGINAQTTGETCEGKTNGAVCAGAGTAGEEWALLIV